MRYRPARPKPAPPPLPENPYRRFFTQNRSFEELVRQAREREKAPKDAPEKQR